MEDVLVFLTMNVEGFWGVEVGVEGVEFAVIGEAWEEVDVERNTEFAGDEEVGWGCGDPNKKEEWTVLKVETTRPAILLPKVGLAFLGSFQDSEDLLEDFSLWLALNFSVSSIDDRFCLLMEDFLSCFSRLIWESNITGSIFVNVKYGWPSGPWTGIKVGLKKDNHEVYSSNDSALNWSVWLSPLISNRNILLFMILAVHNKLFKTKISFFCFCLTLFELFPICEEFKSE